MAYAQYRPENALRRARDYEAAGEKDKAMEHLYEILTARKMGRQWQQAHETMMLKFVEHGFCFLFNKYFRKICLGIFDYFIQKF